MSGLRPCPDNAEPSPNWIGAVAMRKRSPFLRGNSSAIIAWPAVLLPRISPAPVCRRTAASASAAPAVCRFTSTATGMDKASPFSLDCTMPLPQFRSALGLLDEQLGRRRRAGVIVARSVAQIENQPRQLVRRGQLAARLAHGARQPVPNPFNSQVTDLAVEYARLAYHRRVSPGLGRCGVGDRANPGTETGDQRLHRRLVQLRLAHPGKVCPDKVINFLEVRPGSFIALCLSPQQNRLGTKERQPNRQERFDPNAYHSRLQCAIERRK